jgi:ABC-type multidrug transport system permease subunit
MKFKKPVMHRAYSDPEYSNSNDEGLELGVELVLILLFTLVAVAILSFLWYQVLGVDTSALEARGVAYIASYGVIVSPYAISWLVWIAIGIVVMYFVGRIAFWLDIFGDDDYDYVDDDGEI